MTSARRGPAPISRGILALLPLLLGMPAAALAADLLVSDRMHHLRSGGEREWAEFPEQAGGSELVLAFDAKPNEVEHTLRLRHRDLKQDWRMLLNGQEIARLPPDEADTITYWAVPPRLLADGRNELRVHCTGSGGDDVMIGQVTLIDRPVQRVLSEATVDIPVRQEPGGRATPSRITVVDEHGTLISGRKRVRAAPRGQAGRCLQRHGRCAAEAAGGPLCHLRGTRIRVQRREDRRRPGPRRERVAAAVDPARGGHGGLGRDGHARAHRDVRAARRCGHRRAHADDCGRRHRAPGVGRTQHARRFRRSRAPGARAPAFHAGARERGDDAVARPFQCVSAAGRSPGDRPAARRTGRGFARRSGAWPPARRSC